MLIRGRMQNGVVVLTDGVQLREGQEVDVIVLPQSADPGSEAELVNRKERQAALRQLIGICKTNSPPNDQEVQRILEQERMKKYG